MMPLEGQSTLAQHHHDWPAVAEEAARHASAGLAMTQMVLAPSLLAAQLVVAWLKFEWNQFQLRRSRRSSFLEIN